MVLAKCVGVEGTAEGAGLSLGMFLPILGDLREAKRSRRLKGFIAEFDGTDVGLWSEGGRATWKNTSPILVQCFGCKCLWLYVRLCLQTVANKEVAGGR